MLYWHILDILNKGEPAVKDKIAMTQRSVKSVADTKKKEESDDNNDDGRDIYAIQSAINTVELFHMAIKNEYPIRLYFEVIHSFIPLLFLAPLCHPVHLILCHISSHII
jgi:hypothetical protein